MTNNAKKNAQNYFGGLPTGPDVRKLQEHFPDMESRLGTTIPHEEIEKVLNLKRHETRYKVVTMAWRKRLAQDSNGRIQIRGDLREIIGIGFRVLNDSEMIQFHSDLRHGMTRKGRKAYVVLANTDEANLSEDEKRVRSHGLHAMKMIQSAIIESRRFIPTIPEPPKDKKG